MRRSLTALLAIVFAAACASTPSGSQPAPTAMATYRADETHSPVEPIPSAMLHDAARNKDVEMAIAYPTKGTQPFPVIIFSHDYGLSKNAYTQMMEYWTGQGYVTISPNHADAGAMKGIIDQRRAEMEKQREEMRQQGRTMQRGPMQQQAARPAFDFSEATWQSQTTADWRNRAQDIRFIMDSLDQLEQKYPELKGRLDHSKIGLAGHAYGAFTVLLAAGMRSFVETPPLQFTPDPRIRAVIAASPQGLGEHGLTQESWTNLTMPVMYMSGSNDRSGQVHEATWRRDPFVNSPAGDKYFVTLQGAGHNAYAGAQGLSEEPAYPGRPMTTTGGYQQPGTMSSQPRQNSGLPGINRALFDAIKMTSIAFWDSYLKNDSKGRDYLNKVSADSGGRVTIEKK